jgi:hypothetical protein
MDCVGISWLIISNFYHRVLIAVGVAQDVIGRRLVHLFHQTSTGELFCCLWNSKSEIVAIFPLYLKFLPLSLETEKVNGFNQ